MVMTQTSKFLISTIHKFLMLCTFPFEVILIKFLTMTKSDVYTYNYNYVYERNLNNYVTTLDAVVKPFMGDLAFEKLHNLSYDDFNDFTTIVFVNIASYNKWCYSSPYYY
jgi:hypothetical protein